MGKSRHQHHDHDPEAADKKALRHVEGARASYTKADERVAALRARLARAEEKLARRATRLAKAEDALASLADERDSVTAEQHAPDITMTIADSDGAAPAHAVDDGAATAGTTAADAAQLSVQAIDDLAPIATAAGDGANGVTPRRSRSRRAPATTDEV